VPVLGLAAVLVLVTRPVVAMLATLRRLARLGCAQGQQPSRAKRVLVRS